MKKYGVAQPIDSCGMAIHYSTYLITLINGAAILTVNLIQNLDWYNRLRITLYFCLVFGTLPIEYILFKVCS